MKCYIPSLVFPVLIAAASLPDLQALGCNHDNCLVSQTLFQIHQLCINHFKRAMIKSASGFCATYSPTPTPTSLPVWASACGDSPTRIQSGCACLATASSTPEVPTIWLAGDSTEAPDGGHNGTEGWGQYLQYSFNIKEAFVNNSAYAGRSARSFTREGRFQAIADRLKPGDWVIIEFGHNDGGSPYPASKDIGRADCPGAGLCPFLLTIGYSKLELT